MGRRVHRTKHRGCGLTLGVLALVLSAVHPADATIEYKGIELSGNYNTQTLIRTNGENYQFAQNRNTIIGRIDWEWLKNGKFLERFDVPFIKRSKLFLIYRPVFDSFYAIAPGGRQRGLTRYDDLVGGPISGNQIGAVTNTPGGPELLDGLYTRLNTHARRSLRFENHLREIYVDLKLKDIPLSLRIGKQQIIWGESDQFRIMDIWNPLDLTWHLQQEEWDQIRIPTFAVKGIWSLSSFWGLTNSFVEVVWNPGDFEPGSKLAFLPRPWGIPVPHPTREGQIQLPSPTQPILLSPQFDLQGTSLLRGDFDRWNPAEASEVGLRFHSVTGKLPGFFGRWIPPGMEFTINYIYGRSRGIGAKAGEPLGLKIQEIVIPDAFTPANAIRQNPDDPNSPAATFEGSPVFPARVRAKFMFPYVNIFGFTGNYFESEYTQAVIRTEMAYAIDEPFHTVSFKHRIPITNESGDIVPGQFAPLGFTRRDVWAGMIGFDRPTWIRWLNPRTTWFLTGQFFWSYINGGHSDLRGAVLSAGEQPYFTPRDNPLLSPSLRQNGVGVWDNGPFAGLTERTQNASMSAPNGNKFAQWELLLTLAATTFYRAGTLVPFFAMAYDPVNQNFLAQLRVDWFVTNNFIIQPQMKLYSAFGRRVSNDPWGAGGLNSRRDEVGIKATYQF